MSAVRTEDDGPRGFVPRSELYKALARIDEITEERDALQTKLDAIIGADMMTVIAKVGFPKCESQLLAAMWARPFQPNAAMVAAYSYNRSNDEADVENLVKVRICNIRKRAARFGCPSDPIKTIWACGYALSEEGRRWLSERIEAAKGGEP